MTFTAQMGPAMTRNLTAPLSALLTTIFLSSGVGAASYNPALSDPVVVPPSGVWHEVMPDGRYVPVFKPRDPGPCGVTRPCVGGGDGVDYTSRPKSGASVTWWVIRGPSGNGRGPDNGFTYDHDKPLGPCNNPGKGRPPFCDETPIIHPPVEPPMAPVPLPGAGGLMVGLMSILALVAIWKNSKVLEDIR